MKFHSSLLMIYSIIFLASYVQLAPTVPPSDDRTKTKQHGALIRDGPFGAEIGMVGSSKGNTDKGLSLIRGKVQVNENKKDTIIREIGEEARHSRNNMMFKSDQIKTHTKNGKKVEGYAIHLKPGAKQDMHGEDRPLKFVHHSQVEKHLKNRPEQKAIYNKMQKEGLIKNRNPTQPRKPLERSTSLGSSTTSNLRLSRSFSGGRHR